MGLLDLFRPKWKHSDYFVAKDAVARLDPVRNKDLLIKISLKAPNSSIRYQAEEKLVYPIVVYVLPNNTEVGVAMKYIKQYFKENKEIAICTLFATSGEFEYRNANEKRINIYKLSEKKVCVLFIAKGAPEVILENDRDILIAHVYREYADYESLKLSYLNEIGYQIDLLLKMHIEVIKNSSLGYTYRHILLRIIEDQNVLAEIAQYDEYDALRQFAVWKLNDKMLLAEIARTDKSEWIRYSAVWRLRKIKNNGKTDECVDVCEIVEELTDKKLLKSIVDDPREDENVRNVAKKRLKNLPKF